jgi:hypothetical protein
MNIKHKGFALYLVIFFTSIIGVLVATLWQRSTLFVDLVRSREVYYKNKYASEVILDYGIELIKQNKKLFFTKEICERMPFTLDVSFLFEQTTFKKIFASITIKPQAETGALLLHAFLKEEDKILCSMSCLISQKYNVEDSKKSLFVVDHITIGNIF